jgi:hypothetical protein
MLCALVNISGNIVTKVHLVVSTKYLILCTYFYFRKLYRSDRLIIM